MYTVKGGWVGQTFALAKSNESGGRKTRIRRSKEERKEMIEFFIKKYQSLNNGHFPSLNLTHKEVGGSFYTVREIVREIIQENRVLGPGKMLPDEQNSEQLLEEYPLGTIATGPQASLSVSPNGSVILNQQQSTIEEPDIVVAKLSAEPEQQVHDNGKIINGSYVSVNSEQSDKPEVVEVLVSELLETEKNVGKVEGSKVAKMADVVVETFPIRPVANPTNHLDKNSSAIGSSSGILEDKEKVHPTAGEDSIFRNGISSSGSGELKNQEGPLLQRTSDLVDEKAEKNLADPLIESSNSSAAKDGVPNDVALDTDMKVKPSDNDGDTIENKADNPPCDIQAKPANGAHATFIGSKSTSHDAVDKSPDVRQSDNHPNGSNTTLNRINLSQAWEGESRNSSRSETNPFWAFVKSLADAFVKFWSE